MTYILDQSWQKWIKDNFSLGCIKADMLNVMIEAGIEKQTATLNLDLFEASQHPKSSVNDTTEIITRQLQAKQPHESSYLFQLENKLQTSDGQIMQVMMRSTVPDIVLLDHFMTEDECDELCTLSKDTLTKSTVVDDKTGKGINHQARTSQGTHFTLGQNELVKKIETRISEITGTPVDHGEGIQILNYASGGEYKPHFDYFPTSKGGHANMAKGGQRIITVIMYLNNAIAGGATIFPEINLSVYPKKGSALYFSYCSTDGAVDPLTLHGGEPVREGEKWIATKWIRQHPYQ
ncbi:MAG: 2OG-Fe(II) oxygenase [Methylophilaceae bacterium]